MTFNLILNIQGFCSGGTLLVNGQPYNPSQQYTGPTLVTIEYVPTISDCCFSHWVDGNGNVVGSTNPLVIQITSNYRTFSVVTERCQTDCIPSYRSLEDLMDKANCSCSRYKVALEQLRTNGPTVYVIYDTYLPETNITNINYHIVAVVFDPEYLLSTLECICEAGITGGTYSDSDILVP